eukprot:TRINITY_DN11240_c0_g1_i1.p1 TRINITY_DN11240_c0_g1~~TRINITY_DN11240_c0_g1_i1.p1  ORF type:complete len:451 (+),score=63.15 TRINITY_DN11240_c0_g1_i1:61-1413(+)
MAYGTRSPLRRATRSPLESNPLGVLPGSPLGMPPAAAAAKSRSRPELLHVAIGTTLLLGLAMSGLLWPQVPMAGNLDSGSWVGRGAKGDAVSDVGQRVLRMIESARRGKPNQVGRQVVVIGGGVAGATAALYLARSQLDVVIVADGWGQLTMSDRVYNFPGVDPEDPPSGEALVQRITKQALTMGAQRAAHRVTRLDTDTFPFVIHTAANTTISAYSVIVATGATTKWLALPGEGRFIGKTVHTCPLCDGDLYKQKVVAVVGGGDSAFEAALYMSKVARVVYLIHRRDTFRATARVQLQVKQASQRFDEVRDAVGGIDPMAGDRNIVLVTPYSIVALEGEDGSLDALQLQRADGAPARIAVDGVFVNIGSTPNVDFLNKAHFATLPSGHLRCGATMTSVPGVFAAGEVADRVYRQAVTAAGNGAVAAIEAERWLDNNQLCGAGLHAHIGV